MNIGQFAIFTSLGALVWNTILGALGYWLSTTVSPDQLFIKVEEYNKYLTWFGYGIAVVCLLFILWNAFKPKENSKSNNESNHEYCRCQRRQYSIFTKPK